MNGIFISYRRSDHPEVVHKIYDLLVKRHSASRVFLDVDRLVGGVAFHRHIREALSAVAVVLVIIGPKWATITEENGKKTKLSNPADYLRLEVEQAIESSLTVIPVLIAGAQVPTSSKIPKSLLNLLKINMLELRSEFFDQDLRRLARHIDLHLRQPTGRLLLKEDDWSGWYLAGPHATEIAMEQGVLSAHNRSGQAGFVDHLVTREVDFANFHFHCEFMIEELRAPVAVKIRVDPSNVTFGGMRGYLVVIAGTDYFARNPHSDGSELVNSRRSTIFLSSRVRPGFKLAQAEHDEIPTLTWQKLEIRVKGQTISVWLNRKLDLTTSARILGEPSMLMEDQGSTFSSGAIALMFYPLAKLRFRNLRVQHLRSTLSTRSTRELGRWAHRQMIGNEWNERWQVFQQIRSTDWMESVTDTEGFRQNFYSETARTDLYIELQREYGINQTAVVRLFDDRLLLGPSREALTEAREGRWIRRPAVQTP